MLKLLHYTLLYFTAFVVGICLFTVTLVERWCPKPGPVQSLIANSRHEHSPANNRPLSREVRSNLGRKIISVYTKVKLNLLKRSDWAYENE